MNHPIIKRKLIFPLSLFLNSVLASLSFISASHYDFHLPLIALAINLNLINNLNPHFKNSTAVIIIKIKIIRHVIAQSLTSIQINIIIIIKNYY